MISTIAAANAQQLLDVILKLKEDGHNLALTPVVVTRASGIEPETIGHHMRREGGLAATSVGLNLNHMAVAIRL